MGKKIVAAAMVSTAMISAGTVFGQDQSDRAAEQYAC